VLDSFTAWAAVKGAAVRSSAARLGPAKILVSAGVLLASVIAGPAASAADPSKCTMIPLVLWGDGKHDDTRALNAWFRGDPAVWAQTGQPVGAQITGQVFRLEGPVLIPSGTGRSIERFEWIWPERGERVTGGSIRAGNDHDKPPVASSVVKIGAGPNEGVPYPTTDQKPADHRNDTGCLVS
jgi:hypothetical protein